jgi:hypothetical protein
MGDNPAVSAGPPISLDWNYEEIPRLPLRDFERFKQSRPKVLNVRYLTITPEFRRGILTRAGFHDDEIEDVEKQMMKIRNQRTITRLSFPFYRVEVAVRSAGRKIQRSTQSLKASSSSQEQEGPSPSSTAAATSKIIDEDPHDDNVTVCTVDLSELDLDTSI